jgi:DNA-binding CsgD family transcriptional regulator
MIRQVMLKDQTVLFGGNFSNWVSGALSVVADRPANQSALVDYRNNTLQFKFSATDFENLSNIQYSYILDGLDEGWSDWSYTPLKEYTNLEDGKYIFRVKARIYSSFESTTASYEFTILPPWYRSAMAYAIYALILIALINFILRYYIRRLDREREELKLKQTQQLREKEEEYKRESLEARQEIIRLQNEKLEIENRRKQAEIENKSSELASFAMQITYKNEILSQVKNQLTRVSTSMVHEDSKRQVLNLIKKLDKDLVQDEDWSRFEMHFDQVHEDFIKKLKHNFSLLTPKDLKLAAYLRMNLSTKEIAPLLNISARGVEISRYRLRKKIGLDSKENLVDFLMNF